MLYINGGRKCKHIPKLPGKPSGCAKSQPNATTDVTLQPADPVFCVTFDRHALCECKALGYNSVLEVPAGKTVRQVSGIQVSGNHTDCSGALASPLLRCFNFRHSISNNVLALFQDLCRPCVYGSSENLSRLRSWALPRQTQEKQARIEWSEESALEQYDCSQVNDPAKITLQHRV
jgi:hypothetical protein